MRATRSGNSDRPTSLQERRASRRVELVNAAMQVIRRDGAGATMEDMAAEGGVTKPILYRNFEDRDGLVAAIAEVVLAELAAVIESKVAEVSTAGSRASVRATIDAFFEYIESDPELFRFVFLEDARLPTPATAAFTDEMAKGIASAIQTVYGSVTFDGNAAAIWAQATVGMVHRTAIWWANGGSPDLPAPDRHQVVDHLAAVMWGGLTNPLRVAGPARVFVYGTLMPDRLRWPILEEFAVGSRPATVLGRLFDGGSGWPVAEFAHPNGDGSAGDDDADTVPGFLVELDRSRLARGLWLLDDVEDTETDELRRVLVTTTSGEAAWAYHFTRSTQGLTRITDWASVPVELER